ncbi:hypothetical protein JL720_14512 [Aureococcus anophagefferens]|nr:hypothetical protein JL720_14512 [Aureococcus anophagefferens]
MSGKGPDLKRYMEKRLLIKARARVPNAASPATPRNSVENFELMEREAQIDRCTGNVIG